MTECYCDYDRPDACVVTMRTARKPHRCYECRNHIQPGEQYQRRWAIFDGRASTYNTCARCIALAEYAKAHFPCLCWLWGDLLHEADEMAREYASMVPGMGMEYGRLRVACKRGAA